LSTPSKRELVGIITSSNKGVDVGEWDLNRGYEDVYVPSQDAMSEQNAPERSVRDPEIGTNMAANLAWIKILDRFARRSVFS